MMFIFLSIVTVVVITLFAVSFHQNSKKKCKDESLYPTGTFFMSIIGILYIVWTIGTIEKQYRKYHLWKYNKEPEISYRIRNSFIIRHIGKIFCGIVVSFELLLALLLMLRSNKMI